MRRRFPPILPFLLIWLGGLAQAGRASDHDYPPRDSDHPRSLTEGIEGSPAGRFAPAADFGWSNAHPPDVCDPECVPPAPSEWSLQVLPNGLIYKPYFADPKESRISTAMLYKPGQGWVWDSTLGGRLGVLRYGTPGSVRPEGWQLDLEGSVTPRLDVHQSDDLISADFRIGFPITWSEGPLSIRFGYNHISSHLGDEFLLANPEVERLNYVQDGLLLGASYMINDELRIYGDAAWAFSYDGGARPWWFQFGVQYSPLGETHLDPAPFFAINTNLRQELGFSGAVNAQAGWQWRGAESERVFRFGVQYYNGRTSQYSFFNSFEQLLGVGLWCDY